MRIRGVFFSVRWIAAVAFILNSTESEASAQAPTEPIPANAIEFEGIKDRTPIEFRDLAAFAALLRQARETKPADLADRARKAVGVGDLWEHPGDYRGALVELRGFCRRVDSSGAKVGGRGPMHELWITPPESNTIAFVCIVEELPTGLPILAGDSTAVVFRGFFLKVIAFDAVDRRRGAPLLVGRLERDSGKNAADPLDEDHVRRLPRKVGPAFAAHDDEDRIVCQVARTGSLTLDDETIGREDLAPRLARLAARVQLSARAIGALPDKNHPLPALMVIQPENETPFSSVDGVVQECRRSGFAQFAFKFPSLEVPKERLAEMSAAELGQPKGNDLPVGLRTIPILLVADDQGRLAMSEVGELQLGGFAALQAELASILQDPELPFDRARIQVDRRLKCLELKRVMEVFLKVKPMKIEFISAE
jgi:hypothetical protein